MLKELNIKNLRWAAGGPGQGKFTSEDLTITPELKAEGEARELIRQIQMLRKDKGCKIDERITLRLPKTYRLLPSALIDLVKKETLEGKTYWILFAVRLMSQALTAVDVD